MHTVENRLSSRESKKTFAHVKYKWKNGGGGGVRKGLFTFINLGWYFFLLFPTRNKTITAAAAATATNARTGVCVCVFH